MNDPENLASKLRRLRIESDLTQGTLAERVGVSSPTIWSWEKGKTRPKGLRMAALAEALHVPENELIFEKPASSKTLHQEIAQSKARVAALAGCNANQDKITITW